MVYSDHGGTKKRAAGEKEKQDMMNNGRNGNGLKYRGLGKSVTGMTDQEALVLADMDWKTIPMPLEIVGKTQKRPSAYKSLCRSDNGVELGVATADYKPVHNHQLVHAMRQATEVIGGMNLETLGSLDEGRRVWGMATIPNSSFSLPVGKEWESRMQIPHGGGTSWIKEDTTVLKALFGSGHVPGMAFTVDLMAERKICTNGAKISRNLGRFYMAHSGNFDAAALTRIKNLFENSGVIFDHYANRARLLRDVRFDVEESRALVAQLLGPATLMKMVDEGRISPMIKMGALDSDKLADGFNGIHTGRLLDHVVAKDAGRQVVEDMLNRPGKRVIDLIKTQPGAEMAEGTLWNTYNAVTYFVDHERGLNSDSGLNAALFGEGAQLKEQAMDLSVQYANVLQAGGRA